MKIQAGIIVMGMVAATLVGQAADAPNAFRGPFHIYKDHEAPENHGAPSGWMGDFRDLILDPNCQDNPQAGKTCIKITYTAKGSKFADWVGLMWQTPPNNWGDLDGGINFTGARKVSFWARGERGGEIIDAFKFGGTLGAYPDTDTAGIYEIMLKREWTYHEIKLTEADVSYVSGLFCMVANRFRNYYGFTIYLDEIKVE